MEWQPISTAPKDGTAVLTYGTLHGDYGYTEDEKIITLAYCVSGTWICQKSNRYSSGYTPTHWISLPPPPKT